MPGLSGLQRGSCGCRHLLWSVSRGSGGLWTAGPAGAGRYGGGMSAGEQPDGERSAPPLPEPPPPAGFGRGSIDQPGFRWDDAPSRSALPQLPVPAPLGRRVPPGSAPLPAPAPLPPARTSRAGTLVTLAVVLVVVAAVAVGTALARRADTQLAAVPTPGRSTPAGPSATGSGPALAGGPTSTSTAPDQIEFRTGRGAGRLRLLDHDWTPGAAPTSPTRLRIRLELACTAGAVTYGPEYFSLFDADGHLVEPTAVGTGRDPLRFGRLRPGEQVRGWLHFDLPLGAVTLVMADDTSSVTALRLPS